MKARIILPVRSPDSDSDELFAGFQRICGQISSISTIIESNLLVSPATLQFQLKESINQSDKEVMRRAFRNQGWIKRWTNADSYLISEIDLQLKSLPEIKGILAKQHLTHEPDEKAIEVALRTISHELDHFVFDLSVAANLADLGSFRLESGLMFAQEYSFETRGWCSPCDSACEIAAENNWPRIDQRKLKDVLDWYRSVPGTTRGHSNSNLGRALCAFTYLFDDSVARKALMELVWALMGVEAILGEADQSRRLITDKLLLIFKPTHDDAGVRKLVREMYDFRSRMLHGNRNISSQRLEFGERDDDLRKYVLEEWRATHLATALLSQLLIYCFDLKKSEIATELVLKQ